MLTWVVQHAAARTQTWQEDASSSGASWTEGVVGFSTDACDQDQLDTSVASLGIVGAEGWTVTLGVEEEYVVDLT